MVVILVHWLIRKNAEPDFEARWRLMTIDRASGMYREILTKLSSDTQDPRFHTFSIGDPFYSTYINVGMWESVEKFDAAVGKYIPHAEVMRKMGDGNIRSNWSPLSLNFVNASSSQS
jgi:hypothetical protein